VDVILLASYVLITELLSFVCKRVDSIEVLYVHATIKVESSTEGVERDGGGWRREENGVF